MVLVLDMTRVHSITSASFCMASHCRHTPSSLGEREDKAAGSSISLQHSIPKVGLLTPGKAGPAWDQMLPVHCDERIQEFPDGPVVKNPLANAGDVGMIPGPKIPHAGGQLSLWVTTTKVCTLQQERPLQR